MKVHFKNSNLFDIKLAVAISSPDRIFVHCTTTRRDMSYIEHTANFDKGVLEIVLVDEEIYQSHVPVDLAAKLFGDRLKQLRDEEARMRADKEQAVSDNNYPLAATIREQLAEFSKSVAETANRYDKWREELENLEVLPYTQVDIVAESDLERDLFADANCFIQVHKGGFAAHIVRKMADHEIEELDITRID
jgi:hypothetical protein